jgi:Raf kinase inhibitor-like YbhB/YbcL family protein
MAVKMDIAMRVPSATGLLFLTLLIGCSKPEAPLPEVKASMTLSSKSFKDNQPMPKGCGAETGNKSPELDWSKAPAGTKSFALIVEDPDAPGSNPFVHWVLFNIPPKTKMILPGHAPVGAIAGQNGSGSNGYYGPNPPNGTHHYHFRLYALDTELSLSSGASRDDVVKAIDGHQLAQGEIIGLYSKD